MLKYPLQARIVEAQYTEQPRALHKGNPWIEALPDNPDDRELYKALQGPLRYESTERELPFYERKECVQSLTHVFIPLEINGDITRNIFSSIREGYVTRNPLDHFWARSLGQLQNCVLNRDSDFRGLAGTNANACGFCIVGDSGMGKTSAVNRALTLLPQVIVHDRYNDNPFPCTQVVWMRLECPYDASIKGLCSEFFVEFDHLTGDNTYARNARSGRATTDEMIPQMANIAQRHGLGLLVIDEIQHLKAAKSGGIERVLNLITQLVNTIGIPVLLVGTPPIIDLLSTDLMTARRSAGQQGMVMLNRLERNSPNWRLFTKGIWPYQWTSEETRLTEELQDKLHELSYGNIDMAVKLYATAQKIAISYGQAGYSELLTPELLQEAADSDSFMMVRNQLALEYGAPKTKSPRKSAPPSTSASNASVAAPASANKPTSRSKKSKMSTEDRDAFLQDIKIVTPDDPF